MNTVTNVDACMIAPQAANRLPGAIILAAAGMQSFAIQQLTLICSKCCYPEAIGFLGFNHMLLYSEITAHL